MEGEDRRARLNRLQLERMSRPPATGWDARKRRLQDGWERFMVGSGWEKGFFACAIVLVVAMTIGGAFMLISSVLGGSDGKKDVSAAGPRATATRAVASPTSTAIVIGVPALPTAKPTDRSDCAKIAGTAYNSPTEKQFYELNCITPTVQPAGRPTPRPGQGNGGPPSPVPPSPIPPTQPPPHQFGAGDAISVASYWIRQGGFTVDSGSCNAFDSGGHWVVTCGATTSHGDHTTISVCVFPEPLHVVSSDQC